MKTLTMFELKDISGGGAQFRLALDGSPRLNSLNGYFKAAARGAPIEVDIPNFCTIGEICYATVRIGK